jgi:hypothetical protein
MAQLTPSSCHLMDQPLGLTPPDAEISKLQQAQNRTFWAGEHPTLMRLPGVHTKRTGGVTVRQLSNPVTFCDAVGLSRGRHWADLDRRQNGLRDRFKHGFAPSAVASCAVGAS